MNIGSMFLKLGIKLDNFNGFTKFEQRTKDITAGIKTEALQVTRADAAMKNLGTRFSSILSPMNIARLQFVLINSAVMKLMKSTSDVAANLTKFRNVTGLSTQRLQEWEQQAALSGVSGEELMGTIQGIQQAAAEAALTGHGVGPWAFLGIDPKDDPFKVLDKLSVKFNQMRSAAMRAKFAKDIGLSDTMLNFLMEKKSLPDTNRNLILSEKEIIRLKDFNIRFNSMWDTVKRTFQKFAVYILPIGDSILKILNRLSLATNTFVKAFDYFLFRLIGSKALLLSLGIVLAAILAPSLLVIGGIVLALDEIATWMRGGDSLLGDIVGPFENWKETIDGIADGIDHVMTKSKELIDFFSSKAANWFTEVSMPEGAENPDNIGRGVKAFQAAKKMFMGQGQWVHDLLGGNWKPGGGEVMTAVYNTINVNGARDPAAVAAEVVTQSSGSVKNANEKLGLTYQSQPQSP